MIRLDIFIDSFGSFSFRIDKILLRAVDETAFLATESPHYQALHFILRDDLINDQIVPGKRIALIAMPIIEHFGANRLNVYFEVNNQVENVSHLIFKLDEEADYFNEWIDCKKLFAESQTPWSLILNVAYSFASHATLSGSYFGLKLSILLSLVGDNLNVLAVDEDNYLIGKIYDYALDLFSFIDKPCMRHQYWLQELVYTVVPLNGFQSKMVSMNDAKLLEAGSTLLASHGICFVAGNLRTLAKSHQSQLIKIMEQKELNIVDSGNTRASKFLGTKASTISGGGGNSIQKFEVDKNEFSFESIPINCNIWSFYGESNRRSDLHKSSSNQQTEPIIE